MYIAKELTEYSTPLIFLKKLKEFAEKIIMWHLAMAQTMVKKMKNTVEV